MARAFKIHAIQSDGTQAPSDSTIEYHVIDPQSGKPFKDEDGKPCVVITLRPISKAKQRSVIQRFTEKILNPKTRGMDEVTDWETVQDELADYCIIGWTGLVGGDDLPLQCVREAKIALPVELSNEIVKRASVGEGVDVQAESFRPTA